MLEAIDNDLNTLSRVLAVAPGGIGKTTIFAALAARFQGRGIKTLVLENRDRLTRQTAERLRAETGLECDIEMGDEYASPYSPLVVASVQTLGRTNRLTAFGENHFGLVIADEAHFALAPQWLRILNYFHYGASSLADGWIKPEDGFYTPKAKIAGFTASPDLGDRRNLGDIFQKLSVNYSYLDAIEDGWLVSIKELNIPVKIDTRNFRVKRTAEGAAFNEKDQSAVLIPIIKELAQQIVDHGSDKKGICFVPSVECARLMAEALNQMGIKAIFVSGECIDKGPKTDAFAAAAPGTWLINCALYVYGVDFYDVDCIAPFGAVLSKVKYIQEIYRGTRVLPGIVSDEMSADERRLAIAASAKPYLTVLSPFFISDRIQIMEVYDLFGLKRDPSKAVKTSKDFTDTKKIRDAIAALEKAADKHRNRQPRTINPIAYALSVGDNAIAHYQPQTSADAAPASKEELDILLYNGLDTSIVKNSGQAQLLIAKLVERKRQGLASPKVMGQLILHLGWPEEKASLMKAGQAGMLVGRRIAYKAPVLTG